MTENEALLTQVYEAHYCGRDGRCFECGQPYPCNTKIIIEEVWRLRKENELLEEEAEMLVEEEWERGYEAGAAEAGGE